MPVQKSQGRLRPLVPRVDELPAGLPATAGADKAPVPDIIRDAAGRVVAGESASTLARLGGLAKAERDRELAAIPALARGLGLRDVTVEELKPYLDDASDFAERECCRLAREVGGGSIGAGPSSIVGSAALQLAASRLCFARGELIAGSRLSDASRANLLSAHELTAREAKARPQETEADRIWREHQSKLAAAKANGGQT